MPYRFALTGCMVSLMVPAVSAPAPDPYELLDQARTAVQAETSVSMVETVDFRHPVQHNTTTTYVGPQGATQDETQTTAHSSLRADFTLTAKGIFVNGNADGLQYDAGFTRQGATSEAGKWLYSAAVQKEFPEQYYATQMVQVATSWFLVGAQMTMLAPVALHHQTVQRVRQVAHTRSGTVTEVVFIGPHSLPVQVTTQLTGTYPETETVSYSGWGKAKPVVGPVHSVVIKAGWLDPNWPGRLQRAP